MPDKKGPRVSTLRGSFTCQKTRKQTGGSKPQDCGGSVGIQIRGGYDNSAKGDCPICGTTYTITVS